MQQDKITSAEMVRMFGSEMPIEAVNLLWDSPPEMTLGEIRAELRRIAKARDERAMLSVVDIDRIAAANIGQRFAGWSWEQIQKVVAGQGDDCGMVQAIAQFRLTVLLEYGDVA